MPTLQGLLSPKLTTCKAGNPCPYHKDRIVSLPFGIYGSIVQQTGQDAKLLLHKDTKALALLFENKKCPAGGWYLVKEQREWLHYYLAEVFKRAEATGREEVRILEAGVASYVHHFTYLKVVAAAAQYLLRRADLRLSVTVVDKCKFPIDQISEIRRALERGPAPKFIVIEGKEYEIPKEMRRFLDENRMDLLGIESRLWVRNLKDLDEMESLLRACGPYDVVTEHFLSSVLYKEHAPMALTREAYARILRPGGCLLTANGIPVGSDQFRTLVALHKGLRLDASATLPVWDPYGLPPGRLNAFLRGDRELYIGRLGNSLTRYVRD